MNKKRIPQFSPGEKVMTRSGDTVTVLEFPIYYGRPGDASLADGGRYIHPGPGPLVKVRTWSKDICYWPPAWCIKRGQQIPMPLPGDWT